MTRIDIAKTVITSSPFSTKYVGHLPGLWQKVFHATDRDVQSWALAVADSFTIDDWHEIQRHKLGRILVHAGRSVPYWRALFAETNFQPQAFEGFTDLSRIPIMRRADLRSRGIGEFLADTVPTTRRRPAYTSGSTAEPLFLYQDRRELVRREVNIIQEFRYAGFALGQPVLILGLSTHTQLDVFGRRFGDDDIEDDKIRRQVLYTYLSSQQPRFAIGTPSSLANLAFHLLKDDIEHTFQAIQFRGEPMEQTLRGELSRSFRSRIIEDYGTRECSTVGLECSAGKLHLAPWTNYVEIIGGNGTALPLGNEGEIVVTYFENEVMPFIRYAIGDRGCINTEFCRCGRTSPTITFTGRTREIIELPSGRCIPILRIATGIAESFHRRILKFQLHQPDRTTLTFRFVATETFSSRTRTALETFFSDLLRGEAFCRFEKVDRIAPSANGKTPIFIKNWG